MNNKWLRGALPALLVHANIGSVYCWSMLKGPIAKSLGVPMTDIAMAFSLAIFFLGISAAFCGRLVEKNISKSTLLSAIFYGSGLTLASIGIMQTSSLCVILGYGILMGIGLGLGYLSPIKNLILWFKDHPGLATGLAIGGFGLSKVIYSPFLEYLLSVVNPAVVLLIMAIIGAGCGLIASLLIKRPEGWEEDIKSSKIKYPIEVFKNPDYIKIWIVFFINITCGLAILSYESYIGAISGIVGISTLLAVTAIFNTIGRMIYPATPVKNKAWIFTLILFPCIIASFIGSMSPGWLMMSIILCVINAGYGGMFSTIPILLKDRFGLGTLSTIHGVALSAWAFAGLVGNNMSGWILSNYGMSNLFLTLGGLYLLAFVLICSLKKGTLVEFKDKSPGSTGLSHTGIYEYLGEVEMKDSSLGWIKAIMYSKDGHTYIREKQDFINKFKIYE